MLSSKILTFLSHLSLPLDLPLGVEVLNPYGDSVAWTLCEKFYSKYYADELPRTLILGINPGRLGGGTTGIPFTDPLKLEAFCGIKNDLKKKAELSANFIYQMINEYGGAAKFYSRYYIGAVSPLGFTKDSKNLNYYDIKALVEQILPFIISSLQTQLDFGLRRDVCFCLGEGENFKFLSKLNAKHHFFERIIPFAHPRFILQYRRKKTTEYIKDYLEKFAATEHNHPIFDADDQPGAPSTHS